MAETNSVPTPTVEGSGNREGTPVGAFINDELEARGWTRDTMAHTMGGDFNLNRCIIDMLIDAPNPDVHLDPESAAKIGRAFGTSAKMWLALDAAWRDSVASPTAARGVTGLPTPREVDEVVDLCVAALNVAYTNDPAFLELKATLRALLSAAEQGERDRERLDWLCGEVFTGATNVSGRFAEAYRIWDGASDFREALDAARQPRQEGDR